MPALIRWADFAISAAGSTCWEIAALQTPFVTVIIAENQERISRRLNDEAGVPSLGWVDAQFQQRALNVLKPLLLNRNLKPLGLVDSFGVDRILRIPAEESGLDIFSGRFLLRFIKKEDAACLLRWANDQETRRNSFSQRMISKEEHLNWFEKKMNDSNVLMFMMEVDETPAGHIRYERIAPNEALLSFVVSPSFRGMGLGQKMVHLSRGIVLKEWEGIRVKAEVMLKNKSSIHVFEKLAFCREQNDSNSKHATFYWSP
jgi:RimJ/RimL family protein N-acetyltransferase